MDNGQTIDRLEVEIKATAKGVDAVFSSMESQLKTLKSALTGLSTSQLSNVQKQLSSITSSASKATSSASTSGLSKAEKDISKTVTDIRYKLYELQRIKESALGGDNSSVTSFNRKLITVQSSIDILKDKLSQVGNVSIPTDKFAKLQAEEQATEERLTQLKATMESVLNGSTYMNDNQFQQLTDDIATARGELQSISEQQSALISSGEAYYDPFDSARNSLESYESEISTAKGEIQDLVNTSNQNVGPDTSEASSNLAEMASRAKEAASSLWSMVKSGIKSGFSSLKSSLSSIKSTLSGIGTKASSSVSTGFSKILKYGFGIRSLYVLFRRLRTAVKDSFTELQNSGAYYQTTSANVTALKNALLTLKYQFGAAFEPIFNTVAPALQTLINYLVSVMNTISAFIAKLTGNSTYSKAVVATSEIASNTGSAADSASDLNKQLQGFDELNNLSGDSGSSGGSGSGSSDSSSISYVTESVDSVLSSFWDELADAISEGDWYSVGSMISEKLTDAMNSINWDSIYEKASNFGVDLANFLNGLITPDLFSAVGSTIAGTLNTAFTFLNSFGTTFNWDNFGNSIGEGINTFFEDADFELYGDTVHTWIGGILDAGISLLETTDFELIGEKLGDFFEALKVDDLLDKVKTLCSKLITAMGQTITGFKNSATEKTKLETAIGALIGVLAITKSVPLTLTFAAVIGGIELGGKLYEVLSGNTVEQSFLEELTDICDGLFGEDKIDFNIASCIKFIWDDLTGKNSDDNSGITGFSRAGFTTALSAMINPVLTGALVWIDIGEYIQFKWTNLTESVSGWFSNLKQAILNAWNGTTYSQAGKGANGMPSAVAENLTYSTGIKDTLTELGENIWNGIKEGFQKAISWASPITKLFTECVDAIKDKFEIDSPAKAMYIYGKYIYLGIIQGFIDAMTSNPIVDLIEDVYNGVLSIETTGSGTASQVGKDVYNMVTGNSGNTSNTVTTTYKTKLSGEAKNKTELDNLTNSFNDLSDAASKGGSASYDAKTGGDLTSIFDLDTWKTKFRNLYNQWVGKSVKMGVSAGGQFNSIDDVYEWANKIDYLNKNWNGSDTSFDVNSNISDADGSGGYLERLNALKEQWKKGSANATFTTTLAGAATTKAQIDNLGTSFSNLSKYPSGDHSGKWTTTLSGASADSINSYAKAAKNLYDSFYTGDRSATWTVKLNGSDSNINSFINSIISKLNDKLNSVNVKNYNKALGGIITSSGGQISIPQYAGGTLNAGSVFVAGESGPEIMGHINGRTEILNRSQIASIIHSSFMGAMSQFGNRMLASPESMAVRTNGYSSYNGGASNSNSDMIDIMREQNELLRENNMYQQQIARKEFSISGRDVFNSMRSESNNYYNRTGNSPFLF